MAEVSIHGLRLAPSLGSYFVEDIQYLQQTPLEEPDRYTTPAITEGLMTVRQPAEVVGIGLVLESGEVAWGDAVGVSYGGKSGREKPLDAAVAMSQWRGYEKRITKTYSSYREVPQWLRELPLAFQYGFSQALLRAFAIVEKKTPAQIIRSEWELEGSMVKVPLHGSCGRDRIHNVDKMLSCHLVSLPAGQGDDIPGQLGADGSLLLEYVSQLKKRIGDFNSSGEYRPTLHFDLHGALGKIFSADPERVARYASDLSQAAAPYSLRLESPMVGETAEKHIQLFQHLRLHLDRLPGDVELIMDEWANTLGDIRHILKEKACDGIHIKMPDVGPLQDSVDAVLACQHSQKLSILGGSCIETFHSSQLAAHIAMATQPNYLMAKPGMGVMEGISLMDSEMEKILATVSF